MPILRSKTTRILQVIPALTRGGISSVVMNWYRNIDKDKFQFDFITFNDGPLRNEIEALGGKVFVIPTLRQNPIVHFNRVREIFHVRHYHAVHVHNSFKNGLLLWLAKSASIPIRVCHSHTAGIESFYLKPVFWFLKRIAVSASTKSVACGQEAGEFLYGVNSFKILNNAISVEKFLPSNCHHKDVFNQFNLPENKKLVIHVGRFSTVKNHNFLIDIALSKSLNPDVHFVCIGEGPLKVSFIERLSGLSLQEKFTILPANDQIPALLSFSSAFVMPSLFEGVSVALLEAQASSLQCVVSDTIARETDMGLELVQFHSLELIQEWVKAINQVSKSSKDDNAIIDAFRRKGFLTEVILEKLKQLYSYKA